MGRLKSLQLPPWCSSGSRGRDRGALGHDDRLDALAIACEFFKLQMDADEEVGRSQAHEDYLEEQMEDKVSGYENAREMVLGGITVRWEDEDDDDDDDFEALRLW